MARQLDGSKKRTQFILDAAQRSRSMGLKVDDGIVVREIRGQEGTGKMSAHSYGKAIDVSGDPAKLARLFQEARNWNGIKQIIYKDRVWTRGRGESKTKKAVYHGDHVHIEEF